MKEKEILRFEYNGKILVVYEEMYLIDKRPALVIREIVDTHEEPYCVLTVYLQEERPVEGEFHIKTWSENEDITNHLRNRYLFEDTRKRIQSGYAEVEVWKIKEN